MKKDQVVKNKKAGRKPRLSKEMILAAAMDILEQGDLEHFSIRRIAQELGTVPGNLYTYFPDKQSLMEAVGEEVFRHFTIDIRDDWPWDKKIEVWMEQIHAHLLSNQQFILLMGISGTSSESLTVIKILADLVSEAGFDQRMSVLHAQSLIWNVLSFSLFEIQASDEKVVDQLTSMTEGSEYPEVMENLAIADPSPLWKVNLKRNLDGLRFEAKQLTNNQ